MSAPELQPDMMQGVSRAFAALRLIASTGAVGARVSQVSERLGLHKASTSRLLATLVSLDVLERDESRRFRVSDVFLTAVGMPSSVARIRQAARPSLARLANALGDAAFLSVRAGLDAVCVGRQIGSHPLQALSLDIGGRRPLGVGAGSLALIAWLPEPERNEAIALQATRTAQHPRFTLEVIRERCEAARAQGVSQIADLVVPGMTGMGIAFRDRSGLVAGALSVAGVGDRLSGLRRDLAARLLEEERQATETRLAVGAVDGRDLPQVTAATEVDHNKQKISGRSTA